VFTVQTRPQPSLRLRPMYVHISSEQLMSFTLLGIQFGVDGMFPLAPPCLLHLLPLLREVSPGSHAGTQSCRPRRPAGAFSGSRAGPTERRTTLPTTSPYLQLLAASLPLSLGSYRRQSGSGSGDWAIMLRSFLILSTLD